MSHFNKEQFGDLPEQMSASALVSRITNSTDIYRYAKEPESARDLRNLWEWKTDEALSPAGTRDVEGGAGVYDAMKEHGFDPDKPVRVEEKGNMTWIIDGHHRLAAAKRLEEETGQVVRVPIKYR